MPDLQQTTTEEIIIKPYVEYLPDVAKRDRYREILPGKRQKRRKQNQTKNKKNQPHIKNEQTKQNQTNHK